MAEAEREGRPRGNRLQKELGMPVSQTLALEGAETETEQAVTRRPR